MLGAPKPNGYLNVGAMCQDINGKQQKRVKPGLVTTKSGIESEKNGINKKDRIDSGFKQSTTKK